MNLPAFFHTMTQAKYRPWLIAGGLTAAALVWLALRGQAIPGLQSPYDPNTLGDVTSQDPTGTYDPGTSGLPSISGDPGVTPGVSGVPSVFGGSPSPGAVSVGANTANTTTDAQIAQAAAVSAFAPLAEPAPVHGIDPAAAGSPAPVHGIDPVATGERAASHARASAAAPSRPVIGAAPGASVWSSFGAPSNAQHYTNPAARAAAQRAFKLPGMGSGGGEPEDADVHPAFRAHVMPLLSGDGAEYHDPHTGFWGSVE